MVDISFSNYIFVCGGPRMDFLGQYPNMVTDKFEDPCGSGADDFPKILFQPQAESVRRPGCWESNSCRTAIIPQ